jgi:hypothetical protein
LIPWEGNSCESQAIGGVTNKVTDLAGGVGNAVTNPLGTWANTGGGIVNNVSGAVRSGVDWASNHIDLIVAGVVVVLACIVACEALIAGALIFAELAGAGEVGAAVTLGCASACPAIATLGLPALTFGGAALHDTVDPSIDVQGLSLATSPSMDWDWSPYSAEGRWNLRNPDGSGQYISGYNYTYYNNTLP